MQKIQFDYFTGMEAEQYSFYRVPKVLFTESCFKTLSCEAKVLYGLMLDRMSLSIKNRWLDSEDRVYIIFTVEEIAELMFIEVEREMARYDIIAGKIADDATNATLTAYLAGAFGTAGDKEADDFCIRQLLPNKLKDQYCFKTEATIKCLKFVKGEKIWLK